MAITEKRETKFKDTEIGLIPEEWKIVILEEVLETIIDYRGKTPKKTKAGIPLVTAKIVKNGSILEPTEFISEDDYDSWMTRGFPQSGDLVLTTEAPLGEVAILDSKKIALAQRIVTLRGKTDLLSNHYLKYFFQSDIGQYTLKAKMSGTTITGIKQSELRKINILQPPFHEQKAIAEILSSLDEKIELNRRMNKTLEEMGKALFKRWFVDFEFPNEDGKPYKSSGGKMVDSELGEIPEGWKVKPLENFVEIFDSKRVPLSSREREACQGTYPYYGATQAMDYVNDYLFDGIYLLVAEDGTVKTSDSKPVTQYVWGKFWVNNHAHIIQGTNGYSTEAIKIFLDNINIDCYITGAVQPKINQSALRSIPVISPCKKYLEQYNSMVLFLFDQLRLLTNEINSLEKIKSSLLPKLISGRIRVEGELCKA
jgi:type I restriction enzyme S subunit